MSNHPVKLNGETIGMAGYVFDGRQFILQIATTGVTLPSPITLELKTDTLPCEFCEGTGLFRFGAHHAVRCFCGGRGIPSYYYVLKSVGNPDTNPQGGEGNGEG